MTDRIYTGADGKPYMRVAGAGYAIKLATVDDGIAVPDTRDDIALALRTPGSAVARSVARAQALGLVDPNPGARRVVENDLIVMTSPPAIEVQSGGSGSALPTSVIAGAEYITVDNPAIRYFCGAVEPVTLLSGKTFYRATYIDHRVTTYSVAPFRCDFRVNCQTAIDTDPNTYGFGLIMRQGGKVAIKIDGLWSSLDAVDPGNSGQFKEILVRFAEPGPRTIELAFYDAIWCGVNKHPNDPIMRSPVPLGARLAAIGNSWFAAAGVANTRKHLGMVQRIGDKLGYRDVWQQAVGGTDFANGGVYNVTHLDRIDGILAYKPDIVLWGAGANDNIKTPAETYANAKECFRRVKAAGVPQAASGMLLQFSNPGGNTVAVYNAIKQAFTDAGGDWWMDTLNGAMSSYQPGDWMRGTGRSGAPAGDGWADWAIGGVDGHDSAHPTEAGHEMIADRFADGLGAWVDARSGYVRL